ncbi:MAG: serine--tRNA ligase [Myxococcales bacterium]|nr:serine--tRNA ligase [Myxococcales bacterium]
MLDIKFIQEHVDEVKKAVVDKALADVDIDHIIALDERRRELLYASEQMRARRNELSSSIPKLSKEDRQAAIEEVRGIKSSLKETEEVLAAIQSELDTLMILVPMIPGPDVPVGKGEEDNVLVRTWGTPREFDFEPRDHEELGELLGILDKARAVKFAGGRSYLLKGAGAMLELAVMRLAMDIVVADGFTPVLGPLMVNEMAMEGTGFFPLGREDTYHLEKDDKWLIGTSEVHLVSIHADEILDKEQLPITYAGHSPCFRREAGSYGRDTRGIFRVHQFSKVEQVVICEADPEVSLKMHHRLLANSERLLQALELPYRVMLGCTAEIGLGKVRMHEVETWMPSRNAYSETHSCSTLHDFQARRLKLRYRDEDGSTKFCHTLNNTAVASPRILIPILEHYQNEDGSVTVPEVLQKYMYGLTLLEPV